MKHRGLWAVILTLSLLIGTLSVTSYATEMEPEGSDFLTSVNEEQGLPSAPDPKSPEKARTASPAPSAAGEAASSNLTAQEPILEEMSDLTDLAIEAEEKGVGPGLNSLESQAASEGASLKVSQETKPLAVAARPERTDRLEEAGQLEEAGRAGQVTLQGAVTQIYLDGVNGDDGHDGSSPARPVKSFTRARELALADRQISTIFVLGTVTVSGEVSLAGTHAVLKRDPTFAGYLLQVNRSSGAELKHITIDGSAELTKTAGNSLVRCSGRLQIGENAVLQNNQIGSALARRSGGAVYVDGGEVNMVGGTIQNNSATLGGGIYVTGGAVLNMSAGAILNNWVENGPSMSNWNDAAAGGGVCLLNGGTFNLSGSALIQGNSAEETGGGISVGAVEASTRNSNYLNMTGGKVNANTAGASGGGIFVQAAYVAINPGLESVAQITAGEISNNRMDGSGVTNKMFGGGGIYVNGYDFEGFKNAHLILKNAVIVDNEASLQGGGYAACPISQTKIYLKNGVAIYSNRSQKASGADFYLYSLIEGMGAHGGNPEYLIANTMLGGVPYRWKYDDGKEVPLQKLAGRLVGEDVFLGLHTDERGDENTKNQARVFIKGNSSVTRGGGIGSNGNVTFGDFETTQISVRKVWDDEQQMGRRPKSIQVELYRKVADSDQAPVYIGYENMIPDETGGWFLTFTNLPVKDGAGRKYEYSIKERSIDGYVALVTGDMTEGFKLTNTPSIEVPVKKVWQDDNNQDGMRPKTVEVKLLADGRDTGQRQVLSEHNNWAGCFSKLKAYQNGLKIQYTVEEVDVAEGYKSRVTGDEAVGFVITNQKTPDRIVIPVVKTWKDDQNRTGKRPEQITIQLLADGRDTGRRLVLSAKQNWMGKFTDLNRNKDGKAIEYTIREMDVDRHYKSTVLGMAGKGFEVVNELKPGSPSCSSGETKQPGLVKTGDGRMGVLGGLTLLLGSGVLILVWQGRQAKRRAK